MTNLLQQLEFYQALEEFLKAYASEFIGSNLELNNKIITEYLSKDDFAIRSFAQGHSTKEDYLKTIEEDVLNGLPIWRFFKLSEWTFKMLELEFKELLKQKELEIEEERKKYKCYSCKWFKETEAFGGVFRECTFVDEEERLRRFPMRRKNPFKVKRRCKNYDKI